MVAFAHNDLDEEDRVYMVFVSEDGGSEFLRFLLTLVALSLEKKRALNIWMSLERFSHGYSPSRQFPDGPKIADQGQRYKYRLYLY